jgi:3-isopropylmalate dehydratase small subunit
MTPFARLTSIAAPLPEDNVDTDIILPARFLLHTQKRGLGRFAFFERRHAGGFVLDDPRYAGAEILVAGANFGCGSSREQAPWALADVGIRVIVAPGFGEIFRANCVRNGIVPAVVGSPEWERIVAAAVAAHTVTADLATQRITLPDGDPIDFACPAADREALLGGRDEVDDILRDHGDATARFEARQRGRQPWLWDKDARHG